MHVAIDIGGTFTDAVAIDDYGIIKTAKSSTTHENLTIGAINSLKALKINFNQVSSFVHGTTAGLNALLERRGGKVALITTSMKLAELIDLKYIILDTSVKKLF